MGSSLSMKSLCGPGLWVICESRIDPEPDLKLWLENNEMQFRWELSYLYCVSRAERTKPSGGKQPLKTNLRFHLQCFWAPWGSSYQRWVIWWLCVLREQKSMPWKKGLLFDRPAPAGISQLRRVCFRERQVLCRSGMVVGAWGSAPYLKLNLAIHPG